MMATLKHSTIMEILYKSVLPLSHSSHPQAHHGTEGHDPKIVWCKRT